MADITLPAVTSRRGQITKYIDQSVSGNLSLSIAAGWNLEVPNHWSINFMQLVLTTDGNAGNRYARISHYIDDLEVYSYSSDAIAASTTTGVTATQSAYDSAFSPATASKRLDIFKDFGLFSGDEYMRFWVNGGKAGDIYQVKINFIWRNWDFGLLLPEMFENKRYPR